MLSQAQIAKAWGPACQGSRATVTLHGGGRVSVRSQLIEATKALNSCLVSWNYRAHASQTGGYNCLAYETEILTRDGIRRIGDLAGQEIEVLQRRANSGTGKGGPGTWVKTTVENFGQDLLYKITLSSSGVEKVIYATRDHRWYTKGSSTDPYAKEFECTTEELVPGYRLSSLRPQSIASRTEPSPVGIYREPNRWKVVSVEKTPRYEDVYCVTVPNDSFALADDILTGNCRKKVGGSGWSNHAYGTAIDINWNQNHYSSRLITDMPSAMVQAICRIRTNNGKQVWNWGGYWKGNKDSMHMEIVCSPADIRTGINWNTVSGHKAPPANIDWAAVRRLTAGAINERLKRAPNLNIHSRDKDKIKALQEALNLVGGAGLAVDGIYGSKTVAAVLNFQRWMNGLGVGIPDFPGAAHEGTRWWLVIALESIRLGRA